jgi:hypothetical protein
VRERLAGYVGGLPEALDKLNARLDSLESKVDGLSGGAPSTALSGELAQKLADPGVNASLVRILDRADTLESTVKVLDRLAEHGPWMLDAGVQVTTLVVAEAARTGIDPIALGQRSLAIAQKAVRPEALDLVETALDNPRVAAFALNTGARVFQALEDNGTDMAALEAHAVKASVKLAAIATSPEADKALDSGLLDPKTVGMAEHAGHALTEVQAEGAKSPGIFGLLGAPFDGDVMRFLGFGLSFARKMGKRLA